MNWFIEVMKKYAVFSGRARRTEYWMFFLFYLIFAVVIGLVEGVFGGPGALGVIYTLALFIPSLAVTVRRLHDTDRSGWWVLISLVPLIGAIVLLVFMAQEGEPSDNQYGFDPKAVPA